MYTVPVVGCGSRTHTLIWPSRATQNSSRTADSPIGCSNGVPHRMERSSQRISGVPSGNPKCYMITSYMPQMQSPQVPSSAGGALVIAIDSLGSGLKDSNSVVAHKHATGCDTRKELTVCYPVSNKLDQPVKKTIDRAANASLAPVSVLLTCTIQWLSADGINPTPSSR